MSVLRSFPKDPDAFIDYTIDWSRWLSGDTITNAIWFADSPDITIAFSNHDTVSSQVWVSGGKDGARYVLTNRITTVSGRIDDRSIELIVAER